MSDDAWAKVLSVERLVRQQVERWAPRHYNEEDRVDLVHDVFLHLHRYADRHDPSACAWPVYAKIGAQMVLRDHFAAKSPQRLGEHDPVVSGLPGAERCRTCNRALRTKEQMAAGADHALETRKHSAGVCQACAKNPNLREVRTCVECGGDFRARDSRRKTCGRPCYRARRNRQQRRRYRANNP